MPSVRIEFDLTDVAVRQAAREECDSVFREHLRLRDALIVLGGTIFLQSFWLVCLRSGSRIPLPVDALPPEAVSIFEARSVAAK